MARSTEAPLLKIAPACITLAAFLLGASLSRFGGNWHVIPDFTLMSVYYWCLFFPSLLPYWFLFLLGFLQDSVNGTPPGFGSVTWLLLGACVKNRLRFLQEAGFIPVWLAFLVLALGMQAAQWLGMMLYFLRVLPFEFNLVQFLLLICLYPPAHSLLTLLVRTRAR